MDLDHGSILGEFARQPIGVVFDGLATLLFLGLYGLALGLFLIHVAALPWGFGWVAGGSRGAFEFVDAFGVEGVGDALAIGLADAAIGLALLLHSNYNGEEGRAA